MADSLSRIGLYFDDLNKLRVVEPSVSLQSNQLKDESRAFISNVVEFEKITSDVLNIVDDLAKELESEKMKALGLQNMLQSVSRTRELRREQLKDLIKENTLELERLKVQRQSLIKMEQEKQDLIDKLVVER